ncbi:cytochrome b/b6 domain-containing protein [Kordiimonas lacus]|uniref:Cytochrome b n=1 Tax=Kordiimonas lacus TaxID=637679 RepID=A0A1G6T0A9_9PROT|nr:cytochrome b/b6 domain-containing protein [Kordiimonas lacus]SDD22572.1 Cytochrome b [Kordiimonas lacus]
MRGDAPQEGVKIWDIALRLFHWALVVAFAFSAWSAFQDKFGIYANMHTYAGVCVLILVCWRILWGLAGSESARFTSFVRGPKAIMGYLKHGDAAKCPGHNPLGAWSVVLMLLLLLAQAVMGLFATDDMFFSGPLSDQAGDWAGRLTRWHKQTGLVLLALAGLHILVVLYYTLIKKAGLVRAMITGTKPAAKRAPKLASPWRALAILVPLAGTLWYLILG